MSNHDPIAELENVLKIYRRGTEEVHALNDVSVSISRGEFVAVVGPSGSGKTTLLNVLGCMDSPTKGRVLVEGRELTRAGEDALARVRKRTIGFVFQQFFLIPTLTVLENVQVPALFASGKGDADRARKLIEMVGLRDRSRHLPGQLSGGEMQRVAVARSLINSPSLLFADEPTGNLDTRTAEDIMRLFGELKGQGIAIVMVTHNTDLAKRADRIVRLEDGKVVE